MDPEFTAALRAGRDPAAVAALIRGEEPAEEPAAEEEGTAPEPEPEPEAETETTEAAGSVPFRIVAVTSCPTGIAHTYMAAESLAAAGRAEGVEVTVETQGSGGFKKLDPAVIAAADAVIWAHDVEVRERTRFRGKPLVDVGVKAGINRPAELIAEARRKAERGKIAAVSEADGGKDSGDGDADHAHFGVRLRTYLMSGVSYMVPFVAAGGLLIALSFAIGGYETASATSVADHFVWGEADSWAALLNQIGSAAFAFLVPVLAGYIAYGMADRPALVPGFVGRVHRADGERRVPRRSGRRSAGRCGGDGDPAGAGPRDVARHHAGAGDPVDRVGGRGLPDVHRGRQADRLAAERADGLA